MLTYDDNFCEAFQKETLPGQEIHNKLGLVKLLELKYKQLSTADQNSVMRPRNENPSNSHDVNDSLGC